MSKTWQVLSLALILSTAAACTGEDSPKDKGGDAGAGVKGSLLLADFCAGATQTTASHQDLLLDDVNAFAADLAKKAVAGDRNAVVSPLSVQLAFGMLRAGSSGATKEEIEKAVRLGGQGYDVDSEWAFLQAHLRCLPEAAESADLATVGLHIANAVWGAKSNPLADAYVSKVRTNFAAEAETLDFADAAGAADAINSWTKEATYDKIPSVVTPNDFGASTLFALTNAIHYKAGWQNEFAESATKDETFHAPSGDAAVKIMHQSLAPLDYKETAEYLAVEFPFKDDTGSMRIFLPKSAAGLVALSGGVDASMFTANDGWKEAKVNVSLPKFQIDATHDLVDMLKALGMEKVFSPAAELGSMLIDPSQQAYVSGARQKAYIDLNEKGVEAAAVTVIVGEGAGAPGEEPPVVEFKADHPFYFVIAARGAVLFAGTYVGP